MKDERIEPSDDERCNGWTERELADLPPYVGEWDGHDKATVHARLAALLMQAQADA